MKYPLVRNAVCLHPVEMIKLHKTEPATLIKGFKHLTQEITSSGYLTFKDGDEALREYRELISDEIHDGISFDRKSSQLDDFFFSTLKLEERFPGLAKFVSLILTISHGQASIDRGFSIQKHQLQQNVDHLYVRSRRLIKDHLLANGLTPATTPITNEMMTQVKGSGTKYRIHLHDQKKKEEADQRKNERERIDVDIEALGKSVESKKATALHLRNRYNAKCEDANSKGDLKLLSEAVALKRSAEEMESEIGVLEGTVKTLKEKKLKFQ